MRLDGDDFEVAYQEPVEAVFFPFAVGFGQPFFERGFRLGGVGKWTIKTSGKSAGAARGSNEVFHDTNHSNRYGVLKNTRNQHKTGNDGRRRVAYGG